MKEQKPVGPELSLAQIKSLIHSNVFLDYLATQRGHAEPLPKKWRRFFSAFVEYNGKFFDLTDYRVFHAHYKTNKTNADKLLKILELLDELEEL